MYRYRKLALGALGIVAGAVVYSSIVEPRTILLREIDLAIPTLPDHLRGTTVAFLSDFHLGGPGDPLGSTHRALSILEDTQPDLILLGGDYYDRGMRVMEEPDWSRFPAIAPTLAVPGNHDYNRGPVFAEPIMQHLSDSGIRVLRNQALDVPLQSGTVRVIGLDDPYSGRANFQEATSDIQGAVSPTLMLAHAGLVADSLPIAAADLILSGHTHGAQIRVSPFRHTGPLDIFWWLDYINRKPISRFRHGLFRVRGSLLWVGNGLGTTTVGLRFMAAPEVTLFRLQTSTGNSDRSCDDPDRYALRKRVTWLRPPISKT